MKDITPLRLYARVARLGSFSAAAREHNMAQSQVSRMIAELEAGLGARLLSRTTRAVVPTEAGLEYLARIEPILAALEDASNSVRDTGELRGMLRIAMPSTMGQRVILPRLSTFTERHPQLQIDMVFDDRWQDMVREAVDVGIRVGAMPDASGTARRIGTMRRLLIASPGYVARFGAPNAPNELVHHRIIGGPASAQPSSWRFDRDGQSQTIDVKTNLSTNDTAGAIAAALGGLGITSSTSWACREEIASGALVELLTDWRMAELPVHAYFPMGRATRMAGRAFVEFVAAELGGAELGVGC